MNGKINIRTAKRTDIKAIYDLICDMENTKLDDTKFEDIFRLYLEDDRIFCIVAENEKKIIGCLNLRIEYQLHHTEKVAEIMELAVKEEYRSKGVGKQLFEKVSEIAKDNDCLQIEVCCNQLRLKAHQFYERQDMHKFHYKFSKKLNNEKVTENRLGL
jgi:(aminoalkyl)phosphonate N-acetyltransferase